MRKTILLPLFAFALSGCAKPDYEAYVVAMEKLASATAQAGEDCERMGRSLEKVIGEHGDAIRAMQDNERRYTKEEKAKLEKKYRERLSKAMRQMMPAHKACQKHPRVTKAFNSI